MVRAPSRAGLLVWLLILSSLLGCRRPRLPSHLRFEGVELDRGTSWSKDGISGIVFVTPGQKLPTASLQVGVLVSREHLSGTELNSWVMQQYRASPVGRWHESATQEDACKVGVGPGTPRPFVAYHVCRTGPGLAGCAEADERLDDAVVARCLSRGESCWDEVCTQTISARRTALESVLGDVLSGR